MTPLHLALMSSALAGPATVQRVLVTHQSPTIDLDVLAQRVPGLEIEASAGGFTQVRLPASQLPSLDGLVHSRAPHRGRPDEEELSEGIDDMLLRSWADLEYRGEGVHIAVVDSGFSGYLGLLGTELPDQVDTHFHSVVQHSDHGTAVAEIIHDLVPEAELSLYSFDTEVEFLAAVEGLLAADVDVVNCCVSWDNVWHPDDNNPLSSAVNALADQGVVWVHSAGNDADNYHSGSFEDVDEDGWLEIDGLERLPVLLNDGYGSVSIRWDEPYGAAAHDLILGLYEPGDDTPCAWSDEVQDGAGDPWEGVSCETSASTLELAVFDPGGTATGIHAWAWSLYGLRDEHQHAEGSVAVPSAASGAIAVGAVHWWDHSLAPYSGQGPTYDGRIKPDVSAPTVVSTSTYGWLGFNGTSAAAPHVTGAAALLVQASEHAFGPDEVRTWLQTEGLDLGDVGADNLYGGGYVQLDRPPGFEPDSGMDDSGGDSTLRVEDDEPTGCGCGPSPRWPGVALLILVLAGAARQRGRPVA